MLNKIEYFQARSTDSSAHSKGSITWRSLDINSNFSTGSISRLNCRRFAADNGDEVIWLRNQRNEHFFKTCPTEMLLTISIWRKISCSSRFGFTPSISANSFSSTSKKWGLEAMTGAPVHANLFGGGKKNKKFFSQVTMNMVRAKGRN